jgi:ABC-type dipeptide/oligopeptide/nickel transport system ATPase component
MRWSVAMPPDDAAPLLEASDLAVGYPGRRSVHEPISGLSFALREREIVGLLGEASSGRRGASCAAPCALRAAIC